MDEIIKRIIYNSTLMTNLIRHAFRKKTWPWWSQVNEHIILGAIPLKNKKHIEILLDDLNIQAVLTLLEPFEWETKGPFSDPVTPEDWLDKKVAHLHIKARDFEPLGENQIEQGVAFLHKYIRQGKKVYVHCKAGRGRSATVVACYLLKHGGIKSVEEAINFLKGRRPHIALGPGQLAAIHSYNAKK